MTHYLAVISIIIPIIATIDIIIDNINIIGKNIIKDNTINIVIIINNKKLPILPI